MIAIIDYGAGNLHSVKKAFDHLKKDSIIAKEVKDLNGADKIVLPGVGAFGSAIEKLKESNFYDATYNWLFENKPFLGICLGMQMLFEESLESKNTKGFGIFKGKCPRFVEGKVPQMGWNQVKIVSGSPLLKGIEDKSFFYFLHGYYVEVADTDIIRGTTDYFITYTSMIEKGNIFGVQFHPEKSGKIGLKMLSNWSEAC
ncbi:imidazole glycerol phosphate synthase subunit HisH [candidate division WOR-3 bacterium]|nr:imidazole glycerol phosphate synthase subunit HisH [candidate division WOR-3 bacterium]